MKCRVINSVFQCCLLLLASLPQVVLAEVESAAVNGFSLRQEVLINADRAAVYHAATAEISRWWHDDHTMSGSAANLTLTTTIPGCFCERLGEGGGFVHMNVSFVNPGVIVRLTGGLGPLGLMGVSGNMTWEFADDGDATKLTLRYAVGGYLEGGLDAVAPAVDSVLIEALDRLRRYVETGSPTEG